MNRISKIAERVAAKDLTHDEKKNFTWFVQELERLSKEYGVVVQSVGGVSIGEVASISYSKDPTSGDLIPTVRWA